MREDFTSTYSVFRNSKIINGLRCASNLNIEHESVTP